MEFKDRLKEMRTQKGLSQEELGEKLGISASSIGMMEQGRRFPRKETLEAIADYFNVGMGYLLGEEDQTPRYINPYYADLMDKPYLKRLLLACGRLPEENLEPFILAIEATVKAIEQAKNKKSKRKPRC